MAETSTIEWTEATWNPITGCSVVSPGCTNCYAMRLAGTRLAQHPSRKGLTQDTKAGPVWNGQVRFNAQWLYQPRRWSRPRMIFVCAHGDLFHESVPDTWIDQVFAVMALAQHHVFQVLTKRADRMRAYCTGQWQSRVLSLLAEWADMGEIHPDAQPIAMPAALRNVWLGISAEDQQRLEERWPYLATTPAAVRWISAEPLLGPLDLGNVRPDATMKLDALHGGAEHLLGMSKPVPGVDWIVVGGESGPGARPMHPAWARSLRDQCAAAGVPFFFKQWGAYVPVAAPTGHWSTRAADADPSRFAWADGTWSRAVGKAAAGRLLDGVEHNAMPAACKERT